MRTVKYLLSLLLVVAVGCSPKKPIAELPTTTLPDKAENKSVAEIRVELASWAEVEKRIAAHRGKVVVVDVWSTWCAPCMAEFPHLVKLHQQYGDQIACISLNCNYAGVADEPPENAKQEVAEFLNKQGATFENFICTDTDEQLFMKLNAAAIPIVRVYDKEGELVKQFVNDDDEYGEKGFTYAAHVVPMVENLLKR